MNDGLAMNARLTMRLRVTTWTVAVILASAASLTCLMGSVQLVTAQDHCAGMARESSPTAIESDCCKASDLKAVGAPATAAPDCPSSAVVAMLVPIEPPLTTQRVAATAFAPDTSPPLRVPTYLAVSSLRI